MVKTKKEDKDGDYCCSTLVGGSRLETVARLLSGVRLVIVTSEALLLVEGLERLDAAHVCLRHNRF